MMLQFKIGTGPLMRENVDFVPSVGDRVLLPYPTGGRYKALITEIWTPLEDSKPEQCMFYGEW